MKHLPIRYLVLAAALALGASAVFAHEFWISPESYQIDPEAPLQAQFKNGENFEGINLGFFERRSKRFDLAYGADIVALSPRMGDIPALDVPTVRDGLAVVLHETAPSTITYQEWEKFQAFADHKDFPNIKARHLELGFPETGFAERYTRHAKALVAVGSGRGADRVYGLETEFVALANPYTDDLSRGFPVALYYQGKVRPDAQIEVYARGPEGVVTVSLYRSDAAGRAVIPVQAGHEYLIDAVVLRPAPAGATHVWETLWAALTFAVP